MKCANHVLLLASLLGLATCLFQKYYVYSRKKASWLTAQNYCRTNYVDLVTFQTEAEFISFLAVMSPYLVSRSWIGIYNAPTENQFTQWSDGSPVNYTYWQYGELSNLNSSHCGLILPTYEWSISVCSEQMYYLCYSWYPDIVPVQELKTWEEALVHCRKSYTDLVSLTTENDFIALNRSLKNQMMSVWTGLRFMNRLWFWVNQEPLGGLFQQPSCPAQPFRCGALVPGSGVLENRDCMEKRNFVCYIY
ncbi:C-type mannose receptor 2 [Silurus asotus]|uniref:C-type mannose receptor 2 n=1 Tax=Silurus asotus TaxID=30991 RepID=A0AAD5ACQ3_SILAS|nr:C-type mannose receptor 2 [Silurus asotus]